MAYILVISILASLAINIINVKVVSITKYVWISEMLMRI